MSNKIFPQLAQFDFTPVSDTVCVGTWNNYAVELQSYNGSTYFVYLAIRISQTSNELKKSLNTAIKNAGVKGASVTQAAPYYLSATFTFRRGDQAIPGFRDFMDTLTAALSQNGVGPANTCALTGASDPDSLYLVGKKPYLGYQPVSSAAVRQNEYKLQSKMEENEANGSYLTGFLGAVIGMLLAVAVNVLVIVYLERIFALLFALVPIAAMYGYKLLNGKTNKAALVIVVLLSLLAIPLMEYLTGVIGVMRELPVSLGMALQITARVLFTPETLSEISGELGMMALFMILGLFIAWRLISGQLNSSQAAASRIQMETMRPNPACRRDTFDTEEL